MNYKTKEIHVVKSNKIIFQITIMTQWPIFYL